MQNTIIGSLTTKNKAHFQRPGHLSGTACIGAALPCTPDLLSRFYAGSVRFSLSAKTGIICRNFAKK
ncbi:hypothetical protein B4099_0828 [Heyndrickxia coagulans]|uniref:Uncharacterized protein n=1 Tax=Heyndrickxia coagulans TaxID=1398 RepID=A0A150KDK4_HEYCO|nr:hypothetical protein B4099_0828 [Heyndrickxia coagulans]